MKAQRLKKFRDFIKRAELIPQSLLIITEDHNVDCLTAAIELRRLNYDLPFYELCLSGNSQLKAELEEKFEILGLPTFIYFHGKNMREQITGFDKDNNFSKFLITTSTQIDY